MTRPSEQAIATAKLILAKCAAYDPWFPHPSQATVLAWAEEIQATNLTPNDLLAGVTEVYRTHGGGFKTFISDVTVAAGKIREDRFRRQPLADIEAHNDDIDAKHRILELADTFGETKSVNRALKYQRPKYNPLNVACPYPSCHASIGRHCTSGGHTMRRYHDSRIEAATPPKPAENAVWPVCTACGKRPLVTDQDRAHRVCAACLQASTPEPKTEAPQGNGDTA
jgi:hypothetical protein